VKSVRDALTELNGQVQSIKLSLVGGDPSPENVFIGLLTAVPGISQSVITDTEKLFKQQRFALSDAQIVKLTKGWGAVVTQAKKDPSNEGIEAVFLELHSLLEILYERLETNVTRTDEDILSASI